MEEDNKNNIDYNNEKQEILIENNAQRIQSINSGNSHDSSKVIEQRNNDMENKNEPIISPLPYRRRKNFTHSKAKITYFSLCSCCGVKKTRICLSLSCIDSFSCLSSLFFIIIPTALFYVFVLPSFQNIIIIIPSSVISSIIFIALLYFYFDVSTSPPGYMDTSNKITYEEYQKLNPHITIKDTDYLLPYCETCQIVRPLRVFHCRICDKCIIRHDHHCGFVNNCIGKDNHLKFFIFIIFAGLHSLFVSIYCVIAYFICLNKEPMWGEVSKIICIVVFIFAVLIALMMGYFVTAHIIMISSNVTTSESIRKKYKKDAFDKGCGNNWKEICQKV